MINRLPDTEVVAIRFVVEQERDGRYGVRAVDFLKGDGGKLEPSVFKNAPQVWDDEATAVVWAGVMNDSLLFLYATTWSQEKWDEVIANARQQLEAKRACQINPQPT